LPIRGRLILEEKKKGQGKEDEIRTPTKCLGLGTRIRFTTRVKREREGGRGRLHLSCEKTTSVRGLRDMWEKPTQDVGGIIDAGGIKSESWNAGRGRDKNGRRKSSITKRGQ